MKLLKRRPSDGKTDPSTQIDEIADDIAEIVGDRYEDFDFKGCQVHVSRYLRDNVFPSLGEWSQLTDAVDAMRTIAGSLMITNHPDEQSALCVELVRELIEDRTALLEACKAALEDCENDQWEDSPLAKQLREAIAKAEGVK